MIVRTATAEDSNQLRNLVAQLGYRLSSEQVKERINACSSTGIYNYLVSEIDQLITGLCIFVIYPKFHKTANHCFLEVLVVHEQYRNKGIGEKLLKYLEGFAANKNCSSISLLTNAGRDKEIHNFYFNRGYHNEGHNAQLYLRKELASNLVTN